MPWDGSGNYDPPAASFPEVNGTLIDAGRYNPTILDLASGIEAALAKNGENVPTANLPMGGFVHTSLGAGTVAGHSVRYQQVQRNGYSDIASAATVDLGSTGNGAVRITGSTGPITSFGSTAETGQIKGLYFASTPGITYNATSMLVPGGASITATAGDRAVVLHLGSGNWLFLSYVRANGSVLKQVSLDEVQAALAAATLNNGNFAQVWQWYITTAARIGFRLTESTAASGTDAILLQVDTIASSTAWPLFVKARGSDILAVNETGRVMLAAAGGQNLRLGYASSNSPPSVASPGSVSIAGQTSSGAATGGAVTLSGGASTGGTGGAVSINGGSGTSVGGITLTANDIVGAASGKVDFQTQEIQFQSSSDPTISSGGGTGATISGTNNAFVVVMGTGSPTSVTVAFSKTLGSTPVVVATSSQSGQVLHIGSVSTTSVQIASSSAASSGTRWNVILFGIA